MRAVAGVAPIRGRDGRQWMPDEGRWPAGGRLRRPPA